MVFNMNLLSDDWIDADNELCVRVRADRDQNFMENLKADSEKQFRIGNLYISDIKSFKDIRHSFQQGETSEMRNLVVGMGFLLLNIFLGLLGTFWFRTQQRRGEIALHKAMGATDGAVFGRLMSEGMFADRHRACRHYRRLIGPLRTEQLAQRHYAGVAASGFLRRLYVCSHRRHDRYRYRASCPPCHEGAAGGGVAR